MLAHLSAGAAIMPSASLASKQSARAIISVTKSAPPDEQASMNFLWPTRLKSEPGLLARFGRVQTACPVAIVRRLKQTFEHIKRAGLNPIAQQELL
jgi:hypothetical protein